MTDFAAVVHAMRTGKLPEGVERDGFYYLHTNGDLIFKRFRPEDDSPFVRRVWEINVSDRGSAWQIAVEAAALGANPARIQHLVESWHLTDEDAQEFASRAGLLLSMDGDMWCATFSDFVNLQESQAGFGRRAFDALVDLAKGGLTP